MSKYQELLARKAAVDKQAAELAEQIQEARLSEHAEAIAKIKAMMADHGVTLADLGGKGGTRGRTKRAASAVAGSKVAPKYRNQATGDTWSGRGLQPKWLKAALASGRKIEEFKL